MHSHKSEGGEGLWAALSHAGVSWGTLLPDDCLLAIDDTDNLESRGTGFRARELALQLADAGLARPRGISRHQLLVDPRVPYTSHNSSACLVLTGVASLVDTFEFGKGYLLREAAEGSDAGIVVARRSAVHDAIRQFGRRAQNEVLEKDEAVGLAAEHDLLMAGLTGTGGGVIGALSAVGLNAAGDDGRFLWIRGLREAADTCRSVASLEQMSNLAVETIDGEPINNKNELVELGAWPRAVLRGGKPVLLVEETDGSADCTWRVVAREYIKRF